MYNIYGKCWYEDSESDSVMRSATSLGEDNLESKKTSGRYLTTANYTPWTKWLTKDNLKIVDGTTVLTSEDLDMPKNGMASGAPDCSYGGPFADYMNDPGVREQLNIPEEFTDEWSLCYPGDDFGYEVLPEGSQWIYEDLVGSGIEVLKFSGDNDLVISTMGTEQWLNNLNWEVSREWAPYTLEDRQTAGYIQAYNDNEFTFATVHNAGHMVPLDQRERAYHLIFNWMFKRLEFDPNYRAEPHQKPHQN